MQNKHCIIIHGCPDDSSDKIYNKHWIPWTKKELISKGIDAKVPIMPNSRAPNYLKFKKEFEKYPVDKNTILVGHSCGCAFLVHWLGETKKEISKLILIAPWKMPEKGSKTKEIFYNYEVDKTIKSRVGKITMFTSDNEDPRGKESLKIFHDSIGGDIINIPNHGHYVIGHMKTEKFPELIAVVMK